MQEILIKIKYNRKQFSSALDTLEEAIHTKDLNIFLCDATIQRFEYTYETTWKFMKSILSFYGTQARNPREAFMESLALEWIKNHEVWERMIEDRNLTTHTYRERTAEQLYQAIKSDYYPAFYYFKEQIAEVMLKIEQST